ncbi:hypothetical protein ACR42D_04885 [Desulfovibrio caledoniensis]
MFKSELPTTPLQLAVKEGASMLKNNVFSPIVVLALAVLTATALIVTKRPDNDLICYVALGGAGLVVAFVVGCYLYILIKKDVLFRSDEYAALHAGFKGTGGEIQEASSSNKTSRGKQSTKKGAGNE